MQKFYRLLPLLLLIFIDSFSYFVVIPVLLKLFYSHQFNLIPASTTLSDRNILTGITVSLAPMAALFFSPFIGFASDKYGRKKALAMCIGFVIIGFILPMIGILYGGVSLILIGRLLAGIGSASQPIAQATVTDLCINEDRALYLGFIAVAMTLALILGPIAGSALSDFHLNSHFSIITPYLFALSLSLMNLSLIVLCFKETKINKQSTMPFQLKYVITKFIPFVKTNRISLLMVSFFFLELAWSQYYQSIPLFLKNHWDFSTEKIGIFSSTMGTTMSFGLLLLYPFFLKKMTAKTIMHYSLFFILLGLIGCNFTTGTMPQWFFANLVSVFTGCAYVSLVTVIANHVDDEHHGLVMGYLSTALYTAWMITAFNSGFLITWHENLPLIFAALFALFSVLPTQFWKKN